MLTARPIINWFRSRTLGTKIYLALTSILVPVFVLTIAIQFRVTEPLLREEVRQVGLSVCRSLSSDIVAQSLISKPPQLEARILELLWQQPSIVHIDVVTKELEKGVEKVKIVASNVDDEPVPDAASLVNLDAPITELTREDERRIWKITYPVLNKQRNKTLAWIRAEVSLQLVNRVTAVFTEISIISGLLSIALLIWILTVFLKRLLENEQKLRVAETQNIALTQQLDETQRQLFLNEKLAVMGQLTASFAHEIGTPLNSLSGHLQLMKEENPDETARRRLDVITSQVTRIEGIVKTFLASTHTPPAQRKLVEPREVAERIRTLVSPRLTALRASLSVDVDQYVGAIRMAPSDLEQILINLVNNSLDAIEKAEERRVIVRVRSKSEEKTGKSLDLSVEDTGEGISPETIKQVMKPFYSTKAPGKGTGLGLPICQQLARKYGGKLEIESTLGKGTTVKVRIPYDAS